MTSAAAVDEPPPRPPSASQLPPIPASPAFTYASTAHRLSTYNLPPPPPPQHTHAHAHAVLTKTDLEASQTAYTDLLATAKSYRLALATLSTAASAFGSSLEACARLKEARAEALLGPAGTSSGVVSNNFTARGHGCTADLLLAASGVHQLVANHQQILSETLYRNFEVPLLHELDKWRATIEDEDEQYRREAAARSREIRRLERDGLKLHRQRRRDVAKFREHLVDLTTRLDGLTSLHADHSLRLLRESQDTSLKILDASCSLVRAEVDIFESLARKGWSGGGLDDLLEKGRDLFASDDDAAAAAAGHTHIGGAGEGAKLFSILSPKSILADSASDSGLAKVQQQHHNHNHHHRTDSLQADIDRYQSLAGAMDRGRDRGGETDSIFSEFNQGRGVRPFSPQPLRRATDVLLDPDALPPRDRDRDRDRDGEDAQAGAREDASAGRAAGDDETQPQPQADDTVEPSPWLQEGLPKDGGGDETLSSSTSEPARSTAKERERRWSAVDDNDASLGR